MTRSRGNGCGRGRGVVSKKREAESEVEDSEGEPAVVASVVVLGGTSSVVVAHHHEAERALKIPRTAHSGRAQVASGAHEPVVHADEKSDVARLFPGSYVDFTWDNVFVVCVTLCGPMIPYCSSLSPKRH